MLENFETLKNKILSIVLILMLISTMFVLTGCGETTTEEGEESKTNIPVASDAINAENYGDYVDYSIDLNDDGDTTNDWKIFYNDDDYVYIIASDYLDNSLIPSSAEMTTKDEYIAYWDINNEFTIVDLKNAQSRFLFSGMNSMDTTNNSYKAAATLLDTTIWTDFVDTTCAEYAIGTPTLEMWVASWNAKGYTKFYCDNTNDTGYYTGTTASAENIYQHIENDSDTLYFADTVPTSQKPYGYWLASPSASYTGYLYWVSSGGGIDDCSFSMTNCSIRPVVSLKSSAQLTQNYDGVWEIN